MHDIDPFDLVDSALILVIFFFRPLPPASLGVHMRPKTYLEPLTRRTLRIPTTLADTVDTYAAKRGISANLAAIELLEKALQDSQK